MHGISISLCVSLSPLTESRRLPYIIHCVPIELRVSLSPLTKSDSTVTLHYTVCLNCTVRVSFALDQETSVRLGRKQYCDPLVRFHFFHTQELTGTVYGMMHSNCAVWVPFNPDRESFDTVHTTVHFGFTVETLLPFEKNRQAMHFYNPFISYKQSTNRVLRGSCHSLRHVNSINFLYRESILPWGNCQSLKYVNLDSLLYCESLLPLRGYRLSLKTRWIIDFILHRD